MIERYSRSVMNDLWNEESKFSAMLDVEVLATEAFMLMGVVPKEDYKLIKENAKFDIAEIKRIELETKHDVIAFTKSISNSLGDEKRWVHYGLTSTDIVDTANGVILKRVNDVLYSGITTFMETLKELADRYKKTPCIGRTHGVHADITSFGLKFALYYDEFNRHLERFALVRKEVECGKISGAVGNFSNAPSFVQDYVCQKLNLTSANISTQTLQRDRHANYIFTLSLIATTMEKIATEIRGLQRTEVREVEENFSKGQKGSSAMPHKRNPISSENICGLTRVIRGYVIPSLENIALWHERDISHSSVERIILVDATTLLDYMLNRFNGVLQNLGVFEDKMLSNIYLTHGIIFSQRLIAPLVSKGLSREDSYDMIQELTTKSWHESLDFNTLVKSSKISKYLTEKEIDDCFTIGYYLKNVDEIFERVFK